MQKSVSWSALCRTSLGWSGHRREAQWIVLHWSVTPKTFRVPHPAHFLYADKSEELDQFEINKQEISQVSRTGWHSVRKQWQALMWNAELLAKKLIITATTASIAPRSRKGSITLSLTLISEITKSVTKQMDKQNLVKVNRTSVNGKSFPSDLLGFYEVIIESMDKVNPGDFIFSGSIWQDCIAEMLLGPFKI